jgi:phosphonate transport system permease protein
MSMIDATRPDAVAAFEAARRRVHAEKRLSTLIGVGLFAVAVALSLVQADVSPAKLAAGVEKIGEYFDRLTPVLRRDVFFADWRTEGSLAYWFFNIRHYLELLWETIQIAILATAIGAFSALLLSFPAARNLAPARWISGLTRRHLEVCRTVPDLVIAQILVWSYGIGPVAGILALSIHTTGALGKLFSEIHENADMRPIEGMRAVGGNWFAQMRFGAAPQALPNILSYTLLRFEINVRSASVIGFVGAGGIGAELRHVINFNVYDEVAAIVLLILATVVLIDLASERIRRAFISGETH